MTVVIDVERGTPEPEWEGVALDALPPLEIAAPTSVLVVAPHPDDEVLGVGGLLHGLYRAGHRIEVLAVTDGEASHPGSTALAADELATARRIEAAQAHGALGLAGCPVHHLGLPDGDVGGHEDALTRGIADLIRPESLVLATWRHDGHPDHEATGRAAATAATAVGARLLEYPVWAWNWARPDDPSVPWARARTVPLAAEAHRAKRRAIRAFRTQLAPIGPTAADGPVLPERVLAHHQRRFEVVFT